MAIELFGSVASRLHQSSLPSSGSAFYGKAGECLIRRTAVVRTRMPGGVGEVAPREAPLSRLTAAARGALPEGRSGRRDGPVRSNKGICSIDLKQLTALSPVTNLLNFF